MENEIIHRIKCDTNNIKDMIYRSIKQDKHTIYIVYNEPLTSSHSISDFIIRSIKNISIKKDPIDTLYNNITNFKIKKIDTYEDILKYIYSGFTIVMVDGIDEYLALETKANLAILCF